MQDSLNDLDQLESINLTDELDQIDGQEQPEEEV